MEIQNGKLYKNRTWKYLYPSLKEYDVELMNYLASFFKLGVGIDDLNFKSSEAHCLFILIDTKVILVNAREAQEYQNEFAKFLDWLSHRFYYVADYPFDTNGKHMVVIRLPLKHRITLEAFKKGLYSKMYTPKEVVAYFKYCVLSNKAVELERNKEISNTRDILMKDKNYIPTFVNIVNKKYKTDATNDDFEGAELDFPPDFEEEIFNYE